MNALREMAIKWKFGVFDIVESNWLLDCFDNPHGFETVEKAQNHLLLYTTTTVRFEVRPFPKGLYGGEA